LLAGVGFSAGAVVAAWCFLCFFVAFFLVALVVVFILVVVVVVVVDGVGAVAA